MQGLASPRASGRPSALHQDRGLHALSLSSPPDIEPEDNPQSPQAQVGSFGRATSQTCGLQCTRSVDVLHVNMTHR